MLRLSGRLRLSSRERGQTQKIKIQRLKQVAMPIAITHARQGVSAIFPGFGSNGKQSK